MCEQCVTPRAELEEWGNLLLAKYGEIPEGALRLLVTSALFLESATDFPQSNDAPVAVNRVIAALGWVFDMESLQAAHGLCLSHGQYGPMSAALAN